MAAFYRSIALAVFLSACGSQQEEPSWNGGLYRVWEPTAPFVGNLILHHGHDCFDGCRYGVSLVPVAEKFAALGFRVYGMEMPSLPHTGPMSRFTDPVTDLLESVGPAYMVGLSGGGWTTTVMTSIDSRILRGYSVAGDTPPWVPGGGGDDWEQQNTDYVRIYAAAAGRLVHVYNFYEGGPMAGLTGNLGYEYVNDYTGTTHAITDWTIEFISRDIQANRGS